MEAWVLPTEHYQEDGTLLCQAPRCSFHKGSLPLPPGVHKQSGALEAQPGERLSLGSAVGQSHHGLQAQATLHC